MGNLIEIIVWVIQFVIGFHLITPLILYLLFRIRKRVNQSEQKEVSVGDYAVIITAYEQTSLLPDVVASVLRLDHPNFLVYVVADNCDISDLSFEDDRVRVLRPEQVLSNNVKSHFYAIRHFRRPHDRLTIIDSDNIVDAQYLRELDKCFDLGYQAVQGVRKAKNLNTMYARLDAARDIYYHFYDGKVLFGAGSSATLAGSGMAFTTTLYQTCLEQLEISGAGFDKVLQYEIVKRNIRIAFTEKAVVFDEKTAYSDQLVKQRARWINTWFKYVNYGYVLTIKGIQNISVNQLLFGIILVRPPLFILLGLAVASLIINLFFVPIASIIWFIGLIAFIFGFFLSLMMSPTDRMIYRSLMGIPSFVYYQLISLTKSKEANRISVATKHYSHETVEDIANK